MNMKANYLRNGGFRYFEVGFLMVGKRVMSQKWGSVFQRRRETTEKGNNTYCNQSLAPRTHYRPFSQTLYFTYSPGPFHNSSEVIALAKPLILVYPNNGGLFFSPNDDSRVRQFSANISFPWRHPCPRILCMSLPSVTCGFHSNVFVNWISWICKVASTTVASQPQCY